jgi:hypothetical protein
MHDFIGNIVIFIFISLGGLFLINYILQKIKGNYVKNWRMVSVYFLVLNFLIIYIFPWQLDYIYKAFDYFGVFLLGGTIFISFWTYYYAKRLFVGYDDEKHQGVYFLILSYHYLAPKILEIVFQQLSILVLVHFLSSFNLSFSFVVLASVLLFGSAHFPLYFKMDKKIANLLLFFSVTAGVIFPIFLLIFDRGLVYNICLHLLFYSLLSLSFWSKQGVQNNKKSV